MDIGFLLLVFLGSGLALSGYWNLDIGFKVGFSKDWIRFFSKDIGVVSDVKVHLFGALGGGFTSYAALLRCLVDIWG